MPFPCHWIFPILQPTLSPSPLPSAKWKRKSRQYMFKIFRLVNVVLSIGDHFWFGTLSDPKHTSAIMFMSCSLKISTGWNFVIVLSFCLVNTNRTPLMPDPAFHMLEKPFFVRLDLDIYRHTKIIVADEATECVDFVGYNIIIYALEKGNQGKRCRWQPLFIFNTISIPFCQR